MPSPLGFQMMVVPARSIGINRPIALIVQNNYQCDRLFLHAHSCPKLFTDRSTVAGHDRQCASITLSDSASAGIAGPPHALPTLPPPKTSPLPSLLIPLPQSPVPSGTMARMAGQAAGAKGSRTRSPRGCLILQFERGARVGTWTFAELESSG